MVAYTCDFDSVDGSFALASLCMMSEPGIVPKGLDDLRREKAHALFLLLLTFLLSFTGPACWLAKEYGESPSSYLLFYSAMPLKYHLMMTRIMIN